MVQVVEQLLYAVTALMLQLPISILCNEVYYLSEEHRGLLVWSVISVEIIYTEFARALHL
jgi:hypothetical protein